MKKKEIDDEYIKKILSFLYKVVNNEEKDQIENKLTEFLEGLNSIEIFTIIDLIKEKYFEKMKEFDTIYFDVNSTVCYNIEHVEDMCKINPNYKKFTTYALFIKKLEDLIKYLKYGTKVEEQKERKRKREENIFDPEILENAIKKSKIPNEFIDPISKEIMMDPVMDIFGDSYNRKEIVTWLEKHDTSPLSNRKFNSKILIENRCLKSCIEKWKKKVYFKHKKSLSKSQN